MNTRYIYLRNTDRTPVGCVAYSSDRDGNFYYGVSFLNSDVDPIKKDRARKIASSRLALAVTGIKRNRCQDRFRFCPNVNGNINDKVVGLLTFIAEQPLHRNYSVRNRMCNDLRFTANLLQNQKRKVA